MTQAIEPYSVHTIIGEGVINKQGTIERVKNVLTGRVFENWRENLLSIATVYYVIKAALSFFSGHWLTCIAEFSTSGFMAILRKEISDFTNLHKATSSYREQNMEFALSNLDLRENINQFKAQLGTLKEESAKFQSSNAEYAFNNEVHRGLLDTLSETTEELGKEIRDAITSGNTLNGRILDKFLEGVDRIKDEKQLLEGFTGEMRQEHQEHLDQLNQVLDQVKQTGNRHIQIVTEANDEIKKSQATLGKIREDLANYEGQAETLRHEIAHLQKVRVGLQQDELRIRATIGDLEGATKRNAESANLITGGFKALFYKTNSETDKQELTFGNIWGIFAFVILGRAIYANAN